MKMPRSSPCTTGCTTYTPAMASDSWTSANRSLLGEVDGRVDRSSTAPGGASEAPVQPDRGTRDHHDLEQLRDRLRRGTVARSLPERERGETPRLVEPAAVEVLGARLLDGYDGRARGVGHQGELD